MFIEYPKIHRLGKEEVEGILDYPVLVQEKIDGANTSIWLEDGELHMGSRTQEKFEGFNGFVDFVKANKPIQDLLNDYPKYRLYGEWLVRHTVSYNELAYRQFYLFDILSHDEIWIDPLEVAALAEHYQIPHPETFCGGIVKEEEIRKWVGTSKLGDKGEGVVIKAHNFTNKFGNRCYAKIVTQNFKEENALVFGGNNKHSDTYWEMYVVNKYATLPRVQKIMNKVQPLVDHRLDLKDIPRIASTCYHDMLTEEIWEIQGKVQSVNFKALQRLATKKFIQIYKDIIEGNLSVADIKN